MKLKYQRRSDSEVSNNRRFFGFGITFEPPGRCYFYCLIGRLFVNWKTRVKCHRCGRPAVFKCVRGELGTDYARDPLCEKCGKPGQCPTDDYAWHYPIPRAEIMHYQT
jgi:hypothetical protein